jgi:adenylate cyclase
MASLNAARERNGAWVIDFGVGVDFGDVMYGNIGSRKRLDFTVIGPAVNVAARLEGLTKLVGRNVLFSGVFAARAGECTDLQCLGKFALRGVCRPIAVYGFAEPDDGGFDSCGDASHCVLNSLGELCNQTS